MLVSEKDGFHKVCTFGFISYPCHADVHSAPGAACTGTFVQVLVQIVRTVPRMVYDLVLDSVGNGRCCGEVVHANLVVKRGTRL